jgi:hypothetical protein
VGVSDNFFGFNDLGPGLGFGADSLQHGEFAPLSGLLESLGIPSLPGGLGDIWGMGASKPEDEVAVGNGGELGIGSSGDGMAGLHNQPPPPSSSASSTVLGKSADGPSPKDMWEKRGERAAMSKALPDQAMLNKMSKT